MNPMSFETRLLSVLLFAGVISSPGCADGPPRGDGPRGGPPPQALEACASRMENADCYFEDGRDSITGRCQQRGGDWVCVPDRAPPGGGNAATAAAGGLGGATADAFDRQEPGRGGSRPVPPPEAIDACLNLNEGMRCVVRTSRGDVDGRCSDGGASLACIPADPSHRASGGPGPQANGL
ncbi:hypothetical protein [Thiocystis violacea]|uniref:hypothetical protein n=1 Tax=Thiocystis violacea TaxID=13725 RepID=UPI0019072BFC|nr:hypothetical protein [Thiocystis violacea]MBK1722217.1 hypothetical protein [Thiocystis violacea]